MLIGLKTKVMGLIWPFEFIWPSSSKLAMLHIDLFLIFQRDNWTQHLSSIHQNQLWGIYPITVHSRTPNKIVKVVFWNARSFKWLNLQSGFLGEKVTCAYENGLRESIGKL